MRNTRRPAFIEPMEPRRMMSVTPATDAVAAEPDPQAAMLLPAIQAAREARTATPCVSHSEFVLVKSLDASSPKLF